MTRKLKALCDGTGKTAHWVFDISNAAGTSVLSLTCSQALGTGGSTGPACSGSFESVRKKVVTSGW